MRLLGAHRNVYHLLSTCYYPSMGDKNLVWMILFLLIVAACTTQSDVEIETPIKARVQQEIKKEPKPTVSVIPSYTSRSSPVVALSSTPISMSMSEGKSDAPSSEPTITSRVSEKDTINCTFQEEQLKVSCLAEGHPAGTELSWSSNATSRTGGGAKFDFTLEEDLLEIHIFLETCFNSNCQEEITVLERAMKKEEKDSLGEILTQPFMKLPFTAAHEPAGVMPMGETIEHPPPKSPEGHPGIDFQWDHQAPIIAVSDGKVVQITSNVHKETGIFNLSVSVITEEFIVNYTTLESIGKGLEVGSDVVVGQVIGYPTPVQKGADWYMIHWDFGLYEKHAPITDPEGLVTEYTVTPLCPVPYFTEPERERVLRIWRHAFYGAKEQFPELCNGSWKNYKVLEEDETSLTPVGKATPTAEPISKPVLILPFTSEHVPSEMLPMGETTLHPPRPGEKAWGHPGIDFIWHHKAPIVAALDGEVLHIITERNTGISGVIWYTVQVKAGEFIVNYNVTEFESITPRLKVGSKVTAGQMLGYPSPITEADVDFGTHSIHWEFGTWEKVSDPKPNPEGIIEYYRTTRICPVPYFSDSERQALLKIWESAQYNEKDEFPDVCNGPYKNY